MTQEVFTNGTRINLYRDVHHVSLGSGPHRHSKDWLLVDIDPAVDPDIIADIWMTAFHDGSLTTVYMSHILEHFTQKDAKFLLQTIYHWIEPGG